MIPQRTLHGSCEITTGAFSILQRPPVYTGESSALNVQVDFKFQNVDYSIPNGIVAEMYLRYPNTVLMTVAVEMNIEGNTASGVLNADQTAIAGYPLLVVQLTDIQTNALIVACATPIKVSDVRGSLVIDSRAPSPSEIVYVGRSPYIDHTTNRWMEWSTDQNAYVDTGIELGTATKNYVDTELGKKADKTSTYSKTEVDNLVTDKANKKYVDDNLELKANISTIKEMTQATADYHIGFYIDSDGDLCQN